MEKVFIKNQIIGMSYQKLLSFAKKNDSLIEDENNYGGISHLYSVANWIVKLWPEAKTEVIIAGLWHDCDRLTEGRVPYDKDKYKAYKEMHSVLSSETVKAQHSNSKEFKNEVANYGLDPESFIEKIGKLVLGHECATGEIDGNTLNAADAMAFLDITQKYLSIHGLERTIKKILFMFDDVGHEYKDVTLKTAGEYSLPEQIIEVLVKHFAGEKIDAPRYE